MQLPALLGLGLALGSPVAAEHTCLPGCLPAAQAGAFSHWQVQLQIFVCFAGLIEVNYTDRVLGEFRIELGRQ